MKSSISILTEGLTVEVRRDDGIRGDKVYLVDDETLQKIARELFQSVRNSTTIDWTIKESVQATLRRNIRRILRKYGYPPDLLEKAVQTVIDQAKLLAQDLLTD